MYLPFRNGEQIYVGTYERKDTIDENRTGLLATIPLSRIHNHTITANL